MTGKTIPTPSSVAALTFAGALLSLHASLAAAMVVASTVCMIRNGVPTTSSASTAAGMRRMSRDTMIADRL